MTDYCLPACQALIWDFPQRKQKVRWHACSDNKSFPFTHYLRGVSYDYDGFSKFDDIKKSNKLSKNLQKLAHHRFLGELNLTKYLEHISA